MTADIDKRRQEIKEKILRKHIAKSNIYLGIALIVIVFAFLLVSSIPYEKQKEEKNNPQMIEETTSSKKLEGNVSKAETKAEKEEKTETIKVELMPPVPEGFDESKLVKISIVDDSQSAFWSNLYPTSVYFEDSEERVSGRDSLKVEFLRERPGFPFAQKVFNEFQNWSNAKYISFWFKGNNTGLIFDVYIYFDKKWSNYVCLRFQDIYRGWVRFVFSTEENIIKSGNVDWSKVWMIRIANNNKKFTGTFYFDDFAIWVPKSASKVNRVEKKKIYGMRDTIVIGDLAVTLNRWYPVYYVKSYVGKKVIEFKYSRVDITIKNLGDKEIYLSFTPYKPVLVDDDGKIYEYVNVKVRREDGMVINHPDQLKLGVLYPGTSRSGAIFFYPTVMPYTEKVRLVLYLNNKKFEFVWDWSRLS